MGAEQHLQSLEKWTLNRFLRIIPVSSEHFAPTPLDSGVQGKTPVSRNVAGQNPWFRLTDAFSSNILSYHIING